MAVVTNAAGGADAEKPPKPAKPQNVADQIGAICAAEGVRLIAGVMGGSATHLVRAMDAIPGRTAVYCRQERVAVDVCDGFARVTGEPGIVFTDAGPGAANAMVGIVNSWGDGVPVLFFAPIQDRFEVFAQRFTKEFPIVDVYGPVSRWTTKLVDPSQVGYVMRHAWGALRGPRTGPVVIGLPRDLAKLPAEPLEWRPVGRPGGVPADPAAVEAAADLLVGASRPVLYAGAGVRAAQAGPELRALAELLTIPVATTLNAKGIFDERDPLALGIGGFGRATYSTLQAEAAIAEADVLLAIGTGFKRDATKGAVPDRATFIQVDVDPGALNDRFEADLAVLGDAKAVLGQLVEALERRLPEGRRAPRRDVLAMVAERRTRWAALTEPMVTSDAAPIEPFRVTYELARLVDHDRTIVTHDAGGTRGYVCQHWDATWPGGFLGYGVQSAMGWALGAAMGAKVAAPDKLVIAFMGDEAFLETGLDVETSIVSDVPILLVIFNNRADSLDQIDRMSGGRGFNPTLGPVRWGGSRDLAAVCRAMGAHAEQVTAPDEIVPALQRAIASVEAGRTAVVEFVTARTPHILGHLFREDGGDGGGE